MTKENISEMNLKGGWQTLLGKPRSLLLKLRENRRGLWLVILFFFLLPWQTRYIFRATPLYEWGTVSAYGIEILGWIIIALWAIKVKSYKLKVISYWLLSLPILAFLSILWAPDKLIALQAAARLLEGVLLFYVIRSTLHTPYFTIIWALIAGAVIQALLGIYQFLTQSSFASTILGMALHDPRALGTVVVEFGQERWLRAYGSLPHPNVLGGYLAIALIMLVSSFRCLATEISVAKQRKRCMWWVAMVVLVTGIFFSFSRAAWIAAAVIILTALIRQIGPMGRVGQIIAVGWIAALAVIYWPLVAARITPTSVERLEVKSRAERVEGIQESWALIKQHPVIGAGIGNYTQSVQRDIQSGDPLYSYQPAHNIFLLIWAELGMAGLILFIVALYFIFKRLKLNVIMLSCFIILMMFDHYLWSLPFGMFLLWGGLGLSTVLFKNESP